MRNLAGILIAAPLTCLGHIGEARASEAGAQGPRAESSEFDLDQPLETADIGMPDNLPGAVACFNKLNRRSNIFDFSYTHAESEFGTVSQSVDQAAIVWSPCIGRRTRLTIETSYTWVNEEGRRAKVGLVGVGVKFELTPNITVNPIARIGMDRFSSGLRNTILNGGVAVEAGYRLGNSERSATLNLVLRPELTNRRVASVVSPGQPRSGTQTTNLSAAAVDLYLTNRLRLKPQLSHFYLSGNVTTSSIFSSAISMRRLTADQSSYSWNIDLQVSKGNGRYKAGFLTLSYRLGKRGSSGRGNG